MLENTLLREKCLQALIFTGSQLENLVSSYPDYFPMYTVNGRWKHDRESWTNWCEGFLGGQLWLLFRHTGDPKWEKHAEHYSRLIEPRKVDREVHDLGFLFFSTYKRWFDLESSPALNDVLIQAGKTMALRFNRKGRFLRSFVAADSLFIDIMMNVGIIYYAAEQTGDEALRWIADQHCLTTRKYLVRGDGSTAHEGLFDLDTGAFIRQSTHQGWRDDSSWARGQAWALYGFGTAYQYSGDRRFLQTAQMCADFYIAKTPSHGIPPNDWDDPSPEYPYESSAAAISASGLFNLSRLTQDVKQAELYRHYACQILDTLTSPEFLANQTPEWEGVLKHGIYHQRKGLGVDESVMWGDYFFVEALAKYLDEE